MELLRDYFTFTEAFPAHFRMLEPSSDTALCFPPEPRRRLDSYPTLSTEIKCNSRLRVTVSVRSD